MTLIWATLSVAVIFAYFFMILWTQFPRGMKRLVTGLGDTTVAGMTALLRLGTGSAHRLLTTARKFNYAGTGSRPV